MARQETSGLSLIGHTGPGVRAPRVRRALLDGTVALAVGAAVLGGFGVEAVKSLVTDEAGGGVWWALAIVGLVLVAFGWQLRLRIDRPARVGLVVIGRDPRRDRAKADQLDDAAQRHVTAPDRLGWRVATELAGGASDAGRVDQIAGQVQAGIVAARTLAGAEARIDLVPVVPLHAAFRLGARLGHSHATEVMVHATRRAPEHGFFAAVPLAVRTSPVSPLVAEPVEILPGGDPSHVAIAVNLQGLGSFQAMVRDECRRAGVGRLLYLHSSNHLASDERTFTGVVDQVCRAWRDAPLSDEARTSPHAIFTMGSGKGSGRRPVNRLSALVAAAHPARRNGPPSIAHKDQPSALRSYFEQARVRHVDEHRSATLRCSSGAERSVVVFRCEFCKTLGRSVSPKVSHQYAANTALIAQMVDVRRRQYRRVDSL